MRRSFLSVAMAVGMTFAIMGCAKDDSTPPTTPEALTSTEASIEVSTENITEATTENATTPTQQAPTSPQTQAPTQAPTEEETLEGGIVIIPDIKPVTLPESDALTFVQNLQVGWNLGNTFDAISGNVSNELGYETAWCGVKTTKEMIQALADAGFRTIRIPVSWHKHVDSEYTISEPWLNRVQEVVDWSLESGLYVILNIHHDNEKGYMYPDYEHLEQSKEYVGRIWTQLAERFAEYDEHLVFETLNEPRHSGTDHEWWIQATSDVGKEAIDCINQLNQTAVDAIRAQGSENNRSRYIMTPGYCASPDFVLVNNFELPKDPNGSKENLILVSVHAYRPYNFALAGESESGSTAKFSLKRTADLTEITGFMKKLYDKYTSKGIGVVIGEYGARIKKTGNGSEINTKARVDYAAYYSAAARTYGMTALWWDNNVFSGTGECFGIFDRKKCSFPYPEIVNQLIYYSQKQE